MVKTNVENKISLIIPIGPGESSWAQLLEELERFPVSLEIILAATIASPSPWQIPKKSKHRIRWLHCPQGRAKQLNLGARSSQGEFLWFLHADSKLSPSAFEALTKSIQCYPKDLHFFELRFQKDGPKLLFLNTCGVWIKSHLLKIIFGDQGFCLSRSQFEGLGGYAEEATCGEDHLFIWRARRKGIRLRSTGAWIATSARKYKINGWWKTTCKHMYLTAKQAWPEAVALIREKF